MQFVFKISDGRSAVDETRIDLLDMTEAKAQAIRTAGEVLADIGCGDVWDGVPWNLLVEDEAGTRALEIEFVIKGHYARSDQSADKVGEGLKRLDHE